MKYILNNDIFLNFVGPRFYLGRLTRSKLKMCILCGFGYLDLTLKKMYILVDLPETIFPENNHFFRHRHGEHTYICSVCPEFFIKTGFDELIEIHIK